MRKHAKEKQISMKVCNLCRKRPARSAGYCRECNKEYQRQHYKNNKEAYKIKARKYKHDRLNFLWEIKLGNSCVDCGEHYHPIAMDFDHVSGNKSFAVGRSAREVGVEKLLQEIEKCELVCANCHRVRTLSRMEFGPIVYVG